MYCKYCGKQIDDDSTFCKYCGKSLEDSTNSSQNPTKSIKSLFNLDKRRIDIILAVVLWLIIAALVSVINQDIFSFGENFGVFLITLGIVGILYWFYNNHCKYKIHFFNKSDTTKTKIAKYIYIAYTAFFPLVLMPNTFCHEEFFADFVSFWLFPTLCICGIYYYLKKD